MPRHLSQASWKKSYATFEIRGTYNYVLKCSSFPVMMFGTISVERNTTGEKMTQNVMQEASIPNPALAPFGVLIGVWNTTGTHPGIADAILHGRTSFEWLEGGAFLMMRSEIDEPGVPSGIAIFGSDDSEGKYYMLYFDER